MQRAAEISKYLFRKLLVYFGLSTLTYLVTGVADSCVRTCVYGYVLTCVRACVCAYVHMYVRTTNVHTHVRTYVHMPER